MISFISIKIKQNKEAKPYLKDRTQISQKEKMVEVQSDKRWSDLLRVLDRPSAFSEDFEGGEG